MCREGGGLSVCVYVCCLCLDAIQVDKRKVQAVANVSESLLFGDQLICFECRAGWPPFPLADVCSFPFRQLSRLCCVRSTAKHKRASHMKTKHLANMHKQVKI